MSEQCDHLHSVHLKQGKFTQAMKRALLTLATAIFVQQPINAIAQSDMQNEMRMMLQAEKQEAFIAKFAQQAKDKDSAAIIKELEPSMLKDNGEAAATKWLESQVFPFFANYSKIHNYKNVTNAVLPDGRKGLMHYTFIVDSDGKVQPFVIALIDSPEGPKLLNVLVNQCIKGRHPTCSL